MEAFADETEAKIMQLLQLSLLFLDILVHDRFFEWASKGLWTDGKFGLGNTSKMQTKFFKQRTSTSLWKRKGKKDSKFCAQAFDNLISRNFWFLMVFAFLGENSGFYLCLAPHRMDSNGDLSLITSPPVQEICPSFLWTFSLTPPLRKHESLTQHLRAPFAYLCPPLQAYLRCPLPYNWFRFLNWQINNSFFSEVT